MKVIISIIAAAYLVVAPSIRAATCMDDGQTIAEALTENDIAFVGDVIATEIVAQDGHHTSTSARLTVLKVSEVWKGDVAPFTVVVTESLGSAGGYPFAKGGLYLVIGRVSRSAAFRGLVGNETAVVIQGCGPTTSLRASSDIPALRPKGMAWSSPRWINLDY